MTTKFIKPGQIAIDHLHLLSEQIGKAAAKASDPLDKAIFDLVVEQEEPRSREQRLAIRSMLRRVGTLPRNLAREQFARMQTAIKVYCGETNGMDEATIGLYSQYIAQMQMPWHTAPNTHMLEEDTPAAAAAHVVLAQRISPPIARDIYIRSCKQVPNEATVNGMGTFVYNFNEMPAAAGLVYSITTISTLVTTIATALEPAVANATPVQPRHPGITELPDRIVRSLVEANARAAASRNVN